MLPFIFLYLLVAVVMGRTSYKMGAFNYGARWNGYGTIVSVLKGEADLPMQYRPLVPYMFEILRRALRFPEEGNNLYRIFFAYEPIRVLGMWLHLCVFHWFLFVLSGNPLWSLAGTCLLALFWVITFLYDYSDCYYEGVFWGLCLIGVMTQNVWLAVGAMFVGTFNKETMVFLPPLAVLYGWNLDWFWWLGAAFAASYAIMFLIWGQREHYHRAMMGSRWMFRVNWADARFAFSRILDEKNKKFRIFYYEEKLLALFLLILIGVLFFAIRGILPDWLLRMWLIVPAFIFCAFAYARYFEMRVIMPLAYVLVPSLIWGLI